MMKPEFECARCGYEIEPGADYFEINDDEDAPLCKKCYHAMDANDWVDFLFLDADDIKDRCSIQEMKRPGEEPPKPDTPIPGQLVLGDNGELLEVSA